MFVSGNNIEFKIYGTLTPAGSLYCFPIDYNNIIDIRKNDEESLFIGGNI